MGKYVQTERKTKQTQKAHHQRESQPLLLAQPGKTRPLHHSSHLWAAVHAHRKPVPQPVVDAMQDVLRPANEPALRRHVLLAQRLSALALLAELLHHRLLEGLALGDPTAQQLVLDQQRGPLLRRLLSQRALLRRQVVDALRPLVVTALVELDLGLCRNQLVDLSLPRAAEAELLKLAAPSELPELREAAAGGLAELLGRHAAVLLRHGGGGGPADWRRKIRSMNGRRYWDDGGSRGSPRGPDSELSLATSRPALVGVTLYFSRHVKEIPRREYTLRNTSEVIVGQILELLRQQIESAPTVGGTAACVTSSSSLRQRASQRRSGQILNPLDYRPTTPTAEAQALYPYRNSPILVVHLLRLISHTPAMAARERSLPRFYPRLIMAPTAAPIGNSRLKRRVNLGEDIYLRVWVAEDMHSNREGCVNLGGPVDLDGRDKREGSV
ncbi:hypothetical protein CC86DRAFT_384284 [Ophiobolus disseminans]|uniref:Uncharacterized protein n=1 Tax=Ophiobolus disseminans TaxID=1469910 RepID=A0A6A6ZSZ8_9PLEO|nr:hypothetical protein CC86DRAFT_384284 [Ophiobolus disseminans]